MMTFSLAFFFMVSAAMMKTIDSACDYQKCLYKFDSASDFNTICRGSLQAYLCIEITSKNNTECVPVKTIIDTEIATIQTNIAAVCSGPSECDLKTCLNMSSTSSDPKDKCSSARNITACFESKLKNNRACSPFMQFIDSQIDKYRQVVRDTCGGAITDTSYIACDYQKCIAKFDVSGDFNTICRSANELLICMKATNETNPFCESAKTIEEKKMATPMKLLESFCSDTAECNLHACLQMISTSSNQTDQCRSASNVMTCFESNVKDNRACFSFRPFIDSQIKQYRQVYRDTCEGDMMEATFIACGYHKCVAKIDESGDFDRMCRAALEEYSCIDSTSKNNSDCVSVKAILDKELALDKQLIAAVCSGTAECDINSCLRMLSTSSDMKEKCRSDRNVMACFESKVINNQACSSIRQLVDPPVNDFRNRVRETCERAMMETTDGACGYKKCIDKFEDSGDINTACRGALEAFSCIDSTAKNNPDCDFLKADLDKELGTVRKLTESTCSGTSECDINSCIRMLSTSSDMKEKCRSDRNVMACFESKVINNPACSSIRQLIDPPLNDLRNRVRETCGRVSGSAGLISSLALCLGLNVVTYFLTSLK